MNWLTIHLLAQAKTPHQVEVAALQNHLILRHSSLLEGSQTRLRDLYVLKVSHEVEHQREKEQRAAVVQKRRDELEKAQVGFRKLEQAGRNATYSTRELLRMIERDRRKVLK